MPVFWLCSCSSFCTGLKLIQVFFYQSTIWGYYCHNHPSRIQLPSQPWSMNAFTIVWSCGDVVQCADVAHMLAHSGRYWCITWLMRECLHWLQVPERIMYKLATLAYKCIKVVDRHWITWATGVELLEALANLHPTLQLQANYYYQLPTQLQLADMELFAKTRQTCQCHCSVLENCWKYSCFIDIHEHHCFSVAVSHLWFFCTFSSCLIINNNKTGQLALTSEQLMAMFWWDGLKLREVIGEPMDCVALTNAW